MVLNLKIRKFLSLGILLTFLGQGLNLPPAHADDFHLPAPGVMVQLSPEFNPPMLKGIKVNPNNPFQFEFILDKGDAQESIQALRDESSKLVKYFLASLTIPERDLWVNLSPYEKDRIIPESFGLTEMGRDLLAEDYMLKQISASLIYPESKTGREFWARVYTKAEMKYGTSNIPINTFNKVWIVPEKAVVYENFKAGTAYVVKSKLKVMLEEDYLSLEKHNGISSASAANIDPNGTHALGSQITREIIIPELIREVNDDKNFVKLRQIYNSLILATWYKKKIKDSILEQVYANRKKVAGVGYDHSVIVSPYSSTNDIELIYHRYLSAFKKGVYNYIKEDIDPVTQESIPRKYFSGGFKMDMAMMVTEQDASTLPYDNHAEVIKALIAPTMAISHMDSAMRTNDKERKSTNANYHAAQFEAGTEKIREALKEMDGRINARSVGNAAGIHFNQVRGRDWKALVAEENQRRQREEPGRPRLTIFGSDDTSAAASEVLKTLDGKVTSKRMQALLGVSEPMITRIGLRDLISLENERRAREEPTRALLTTVAEKSTNAEEKVKAALRTTDGKVTKIKIAELAGLPEFASFDFRGLVNEENNRRRKEEPERKPIIIVAPKSITIERTEIEMKILNALKNMEGLVTPGDLAPRIGLTNPGPLHNYDYKDLVIEENQRRALEEPERKPLQILGEKSSLEKIQEALRGMEGKIQTNDVVAETGVTERTLNAYDYRNLIVQENERRKKEDPDRLLIEIAPPNKKPEEVLEAVRKSLKSLEGSIDLNFMSKAAEMPKGSIFRLDYKSLIQEENERRLKEEPERKLIFFRGEVEYVMSQVIKRMDGRVRSQQLAEEIGTNRGAIERYLAEVIKKENERRKKEEPERPQVNYRAITKDPMDIFEAKLHTVDGAVTLVQLAELAGLSTVTLTQNDYRQFIDRENERRAHEEPGRAKIIPPRTGRRGGLQLVQDALKRMEGEVNMITIAQEAGVNHVTVFNLDYRKLVEEENARRRLQEPDRPLLTPRIEAIDKIKSALKEMDGRIKLTDLEEKSGVTAQTIRKHGFVTLVLEENKRRAEQEPTRQPLQLIGKFDRELIARKEVEFKKKIEIEVEALFQGINTGNLVALVTRYGVDIRNILWGIISSQTQGQYDEEMINSLIDEKIWDLLEEATSKNGQTVELLQQARSTGDQNKEVEIFEPFNPNQGDIVELAGKIRRRIDAVEITNSEQKALLEMTTKQSRNFIKKLEEQYFFREYYSSSPDQFTGQNAVAAIHSVMEKEKDVWIKDVLEEILKDVEYAIELQDMMHELGVMKRDTFLNLYQLMGVLKIEQAKKVILADEMGLGKTLQTISAFLFSDANEMLVAAPKRALSRWVEDLYEHTDTPVELVMLSDEKIPPELIARNPKIRLKIFNSIEERNAYLYQKRDTKDMPYKRIILVNYELLVWLDKQRKADETIHKIDFLALDEAHLLKNRGSKISRIIYGELDGRGGIEADYKVLITGTPLENKIQDLLSYLQYLAKGGTTDSEKFIASIDPQRFTRIFGKTDLPKLSLLHSYLIERMIRRLKDDVVTGLPQKEMDVVKLDPFQQTMTINGKPVSIKGDYGRQMELYEMALQDPFGFDQWLTGRNLTDLFDDYDEDLEERDQLTATQILRLEQAATDPQVFGENIVPIKFVAARELIRERIKEGKSILIFTDYRTIAFDFRNYLKAEFGDTIAYVVGGIDDEQKRQEMNRFQSKKAKIMIGTIGKIGTSLELTQADSIIFLNYPWKTSTFDQAIDRAHRLDFLRNYKGKKLEIFTMELNTPISIDALKALVLKRKRILAEMLVNGNLTPQVLEAFNELDSTVLSTLEDKTLGGSPVALDEYEMTMLQQFRLKLGEVLTERDPQRVRALWDELAELYVNILEHKGSFFANMASLDYLSSDMFPELKRTSSEPLRVLDIASGPSTLYRAQQIKRNELVRRRFYAEITDYDFSKNMLRMGVYRPGQQIFGSFDQLSQLPSDNFDLVNISFAYRYASRPSDLIRNIYRILRNHGAFVLILPKNNLVPTRFYETLNMMGFHLKVGQGSVLQSRLDATTYAEIVKQYGQEFAQDLARQCEGQFTYLIASKDSKTLEGVEINNDDLRIARVKPTIDIEKIERMRKEPGKTLIIPYEGEVVGDVVYKGKVNGNLKSLVVRQSERFLDLIGRNMRIVEQTPDEPKSMKKKAQLNQDINEKLEKLGSLIDSRIDEMQSEEVQQLVLALQEFQQRPFVRTWLRKQKSDLIDGMINQLNDTNRDSAMSAKNSTLVKTGKISSVGTVGILSTNSAMMGKRGGIDLTSDKALVVQNGGQTIKFHIDPAMLKQLEDAPGFTPVIINIEPLVNIRAWLGLNEVHAV